MTTAILLVQHAEKVGAPGDPGLSERGRAQARELATALARDGAHALYALSTSNDARAVTDCYARAYRDKNPNFAEAAALWSRQGPANNLAITLVDAVNGCDRFRVSAQMPNNPFWTSGQQFYSIGPDSGRPRIFDSGSALPTSSATSVRCA